MSRRGIFLSLMALLGVLTHVSTGQEGSPRQKYGPWQYNQAKNYHYRKYEYKQSPNDQTYKHEYVIYYKNNDRINNKWVYFYNPATEKHWARYPTVNHNTYRAAAQQGQEVWSVLPAQHRQKDLYQIDPKNFPEPKGNECPPIPGATDGAPLQAPPADLP